MYYLQLLIRQFDVAVAAPEQHFVAYKANCHSASGLVCFAVFSFLILA